MHVVFTQRKKNVLFPGLQALKQASGRHNGSLNLSVGNDEVCPPTKRTSGLKA